MLRKILLGIVAVVVLAIAGGAAYVASRQHLTFNDTPYPDVQASTDSAVVAHGRYIVRSAAPCAACHSDPAQHDAYMKGDDVPLAGGMVFDIPPGRFYPRNLTPDSATGLGAVPATAIARALRYGVGYDGRALLPFMEMQGLADDDLAAVVSYLRAMPPVRHQVPWHEYNLLGRVVKATVLATPVGPSSPPPKVAPVGLSVERGRYLAEAVSLCWACHTERDQNTGALTGPRFGGSRRLDDDFDTTRRWAPPNITADKETGRLGQMTEDQFVARLRQGRVLPGSPMPWQAFGRMTDDDLRSIYRYLTSLPPVHNDVGPPLVVK